MNASVRKMIQTGLSACSLCGLTGLYRKKSKGACILMYHGFTRGGDTGLENHSRLHLDIEAFRHTAKVLAKHYNVIPLQLLADMMEAGQAIPPNTVVLTFDDGYASNYHLALPVLEEFGLHATVFASTAFIEGEIYQWPDRIEYAIDHCSHETLKLDFPGLPKELTLRDLNERKAALILLDSELKKIPQERHLESIRHIEEMAGEALSESSNPAEIYRPMTWAQVQEMDRSEHASIGAHTHTHTILGGCSTAFGRQDMQKCKHLLLTKGGVESPTFAYPNGQPGDYNKETRQILKELGFTVAVTTVMDFNNADQDLLALNRMGTPRNGYQADTICSGLLAQLKESIVSKVSKFTPRTS